MSYRESTPTPLRSPLGKVRERLDALGKSCVEKNGSLVIQCPAHDDRSPSGSLREITPGGDILIFCHAGCSFDKIRNALGLPKSAFFANSDGPGGSDGSGRWDNDSVRMPRIVSTYSYRDLLGVELFQVVRMEPKGFFQRRPDGQGGYINGVANVKMILYCLPKLRAGITAAKTVFVVEGEKDADAVSALGLVATTNPGGAGKWREEYSATLASADVVILPDNDEPGRRHAQAVARALHGKAASVRVLSLPGLPEKGDVSDWLKAGGTAEKLVSLAAGALVWDPLASTAYSAAPVERAGIQSISAADLYALEIEPVTYIVEHFLTPGLALLAGPPKSGKSFLTLDFGVAVAAGTKALDTLSVVSGTVLYVALEDSMERLQRRLALFGAWPKRLHLSTTMRPLDQGGVDDLRCWLDEHADAKLVIIDTFGRVRPAARRGENPYDADVRAVSPLQKIGLEYNLCVLLIHHSRKAPSEDPLEMVSGTTGITGTADTTMVLQRARQEHEAKLFVTGRDVEEQEFAMRFDSGRWTMMGSSAKVQNNPLRRAMLDVVRHAPKGLTITSLASQLREANPKMQGVNYDNVKQRTYDLEKAGAIVQRGGKRWYVAGSPEPVAPVRKQAAGVSQTVNNGEEPAGEMEKGTTGTSGTITRSGDGVASGSGESAGAPRRTSHVEEPAAKVGHEMTGSSEGVGRSDDVVAVTGPFATGIEEVSGTVGTQGTKNHSDADAASGAGRLIVIEEGFE